MTLWSHISAEEATGGKSTAPWQAARVEIDSRKLQPGDLFVAIQGERFDGHAFAADALAKGAAAAVVSRTDGLPEDAPLLVVDDTMRALEGLARFARARAQAKIIGVTGSVGKTSAKEMLKRALSAHGSTYATSGNYNNHIGTPLNLANLPPDTEFAVFEMGMNHAGEIAHLTRMVRPHGAVVTNVEGVHLEFFDSVEAIADAKGEIFEAVEQGGFAVLPADSRHLNRLKMAAARGMIGRVLTFGESMDADIRLIAYQPLKEGCEVDASLAGEMAHFTLGAAGRHWAATALMAVAVVRSLGLDTEKTLQAFPAFREVEGRGTLKPVAVGAGEIMLVDDSYNASPVAMKAAFTRVAELWQAHGGKGRKLAALGDMLELGKESAAFHAGLAGDLQHWRFDRVYCCGTLMKHLHDALPAPMRAAHCAKAEELGAVLERELRAGDWLLVKGSHGSHMYKVADALTEGHKAKGKKHAV